MAVPLEEVMTTFTREDRAEIEARVQELIEEEMTLRDLRSVQHLTQTRVAEILGIEQDSVSRMERRADMLLSTMSSYVEAMGGKLRLVAEFPNRRPYTLRLGDLSEAGPTPRRHKAAAKTSSPLKTKSTTRKKSSIKPKARVNAA